jgi:2-iminobutanoate/2-iminopropanoate deaminase
MNMETILTPNAPQPAGHYSQAVVHGDIVYISGQLPVNPATGIRVLATIEGQVRQVLKNLDAILLASGSSRDHVLKVTIYIADITLWETVNRLYAEFFGSHKPARTIVPVKELHYGFSIELDAVAAIIK